MANIVPYDPQTVQRTGIGSLTPTDARALQMLVNAARLRGTPILDPSLDLIWAKVNARKAANSYFDYYFSGQDIRVYVDGVENDTDANLSIVEFAFNIQQQKQPLYGYWDYTYRHMLRGTRIVAGQFRIATTSLDALDRVITKAAGARLNKIVSGTSAPLTEDEKLIEKFWHNNIDGSLGAQKRNKFSAHPPFNFILVYGVQSVSVGEVGTQAHSAELLTLYKQDNLPMHTDTNERLVVSDTEAMRYIIEDVELTGMQVEFTPDGSVCSEVYSFLAKDMYIP